ncbi:PREDICTED: uncharacterized protein LOC108559205 isoform X2 [Nicrophorus vespilloides]|uniref:Uncharacterized protein LOC108559205 isoform X2 n=1 Tax=Nicrophorus vespilloides TaxID=110193 RepID=A0ABM1MBD1_NICVS|nr:PREDICTED: uncharacterized protein LOC108559205 isoform X2 [Nicrophorus vespilloides]
MFKLLTVIFVYTIFTSKVSPFIVPDEVPSLLSLIYSNIPTIMKGTDSRLGWGFRLGDRADFQVLVELGPQKNTQKLGNQDDGGNRKRNVANNIVSNLYAQRQREKDHISNTDGGSFLQQWSQNMGSKKQPITYEDEEPTRIELGIGEVDAKQVLPEDSVVNLAKLYDNRKTPTDVTTKKPATTTSYKDALDNVDLD